MSRVEEYWTGGRWSLRRADAVLVSPRDVVAAVRAVGTLVPESYYLGTARHETNWAGNERDTEESGFQSWGIYQLSEQEAKDTGHAQVDGQQLLTLPFATEVMVRITEARRHAILAAAGGQGDDPPDLCAYLAIAHNQGLHAALASLHHYGMDWAAYKLRNPRIAIVASGYGDDVLPRAAPGAP